MINTKLGLFILIMAYSITMRSQTPDSWTRIADYPDTPSGGSIAFSIDSFGYAGAFGYYRIDTFPYPIDYPIDFWKYDPTNNTWQQKASFPGTGRSNGVCFVIGAKAYIGLGKNNNSTGLNDLWEYDPATDTWTQKADFAGEERSGAVGFSIGNKGYVGLGGSDSSSIIMKDIWEYDPSANAWAQKADFPGTARISASAFNIDGYEYLGLGIDQSNYYLHDLWEYDAAIDSWAQKSDFTNIPTEGTFTFTIGTKGYIGTGLDSISDCKNDFWEYNSLTDQWIEKDTFGGGTRGWAVGFSIGNKAYAGIGISPDLSNYHSDFWVYTPDSIATGIKGIDANSISIYPDPATDRLSITNLPHDAIITISDMTGRFCNASIAANQIDVSALPAGVYFIQVQNTDGMITKKFVKQ